ncbi:MAG TPA: histone deacetylase [Methanosarcinales archaeon]|nr:histone deacetylase [Methanosarcinales archaeon]
MTSIVYHPDYLLHETGNHPERKERLLAIMRLIEESGINVQRIEPEKAPIEQIICVHDPEYIEKVKYHSEHEIPLDPDTVVCRDSYHVAMLAAGGAIRAIDLAMGGDGAFALLRPPGHHAFPGRGSGFCIYNNIAIGAKHAQRKGCKRVLIADWDVHHGNGTQHIFYDDSSVFYFSVHQYPYYPGTGSAGETGEGDGRGYTLNVPLPAGSGDAMYIYAFERILMPAAREFDPDIVLVSAGFDAHLDDPLAGMAVTTTGFAKMASIVSSIADKCCVGRLAIMLEGGYNLHALSHSVLAVLGVLEANHGDVKT